MRDADGFTVEGVDDAPRTRVRPPVAIELPAFFDDCPDPVEAIEKMVRELSLPFSVELHGQDVMYERIRNALILLLLERRLLGRD